MPKAKPEEIEEPRGRLFHPVGDMYCSFCRKLIEPEWWETTPCHLCGEHSWLYEDNT